jgi:23S rRNA (guanosine2251-2'-O)-methyltransferase
MNYSEVEILVWGPHVCAEALSSKTTRIHEIFVATESMKAVDDLTLTAKKKGIPVRMIGREKISVMTKGEHHQNVAARLTLSTLESVRAWEINKTSNSEPTIALALDSIQDPQNVGALIRSAHFFGAAFVLMTRDRSAPLTGVVAKSSAGALFSVPIIRAVNLAREIESAAKFGFFSAALDTAAQEALAQMNLAKRDVLIVVGNEGEGLRDLTKKSCDTLARLSKVGYRDSLNASVAGAVALYEIARQRQN